MAARRAVRMSSSRCPRDLRLRLRLGEGGGRPAAMMAGGRGVLLSVVPCLSSAVSRLAGKELGSTAAVLRSTMTVDA